MQTQTSDGNCTLEIPSAWSVGPVQRLLRWYESIVSEMKGIQLDSTCLPSDECGILFSTEKPSRRMHDFWPEGANKWPQHQVRPRGKSN